MKKIKKILLYFLGMLLAFVIGKINAFAQDFAAPMYGGMLTISTPQLLFNLFIVIILPIIFFLTLIVGTVVFIRRKKRKNVEKDS